MVVGTVTMTWAVDETIKSPASAPKAVREGNIMLKAGDAASALEHYRQAETLKPNAREIAFDRGLGHYALGQFDEAREAFEKAAGGEGDALADDSVYSAGASDHTEALAKAAEPQLALSKLESAMQRYQSVLSRRPEHEAARDANYKAASVWRTLKQQLEQQQQQPNDQQDQNEEGEKQENQEQRPLQQQSKDEQKEQQSAQDQEQQSQEQKSEQQQSSSAEEQEKKEEQSKEMQAQQQEEKEQVSREQAERKLREMMQALRDRKKLRPEEVRKVPISPVDKDW
jgi:tetratricopeptide (TPR) repeat protein